MTADWSVKIAAAAVVAEPRSDPRAAEAHLSDSDGPRHDTDACRRDHRETRRHQQVAHCRMY